MDASPILARVAGLLEKHRLETVLIGNAAAALQGAPVTTIDLDFLFRYTPANVRKLKALARELNAVVFPDRSVFRIFGGGDEWWLGFRTAVPRVRSVEGIWARSTAIQFCDTQLRVASLRDVRRPNVLDQREQIRRLLALPIEKRTNFLRKRVGICMSCL